MVLIKAKLSNILHKPALVFDRKIIDNKVIEKSSTYNVNFLGINQDIDVVGILAFNGNKAIIKIGTKIKGYLKLDYGKEYQIELKS